MLVTVAALAFTAVDIHAQQQERACREREAAADSALDACSGDCRFEMTAALRVDFECETEDVERDAQALARAISSEHDIHWVEAFGELLDALPEDAAWIRGYWSERMTEAGRVGDPELRSSLLAEVRRLGRLERGRFQATAEHFYERGPRLRPRPPECG